MAFPLTDIKTGKTHSIRVQFGENEGEIFGPSGSEDFEKFCPSFPH